MILSYNLYPVSYILCLDVEAFVTDILKGENLSKKAKEKRESLIKKIKDVKST